MRAHTKKIAAKLLPCRHTIRSYACDARRASPQPCITCKPDIIITFQNLPLSLPKQMYKCMLRMHIQCLHNLELQVMDCFSCIDFDWRSAFASPLAFAIPCTTVAACLPHRAILFMHARALIVDLSTRVHEYFLMLQMHLRYLRILSGDLMHAGQHSMQIVPMRLSI